MTNKLEFHPLANVFPLLEGERFAALVQDVRERGLLEAITTHKGQVLDGRNRYRACLEAGVEPWFKPLPDDKDPVAFVESKNVHRRDLTEAQRGWALVQLAEFKRGRPSGDDGKEAPAPLLDEAARRWNVSPRTVRSAKAVRERGVPELGEAVAAGRLDAKPAEQAARLSADDQRVFLRELEDCGKAQEAFRRLRRSRVAANVRELPEGKFRVVYADPPWQYADARGGMGGAEDHYPTVPLAELKEMPVADLAADDAVLLCWATFPLLPDALELVDAWGFAYKTAFTWHKQRGSGLGSYHRCDAELLIVATRGSCTVDVDERPSQIFAFPTAEHSRKPEEVRAMIDRLWPHGPRIELFRRGDAPDGWIVWGGEAEG